MEISKIVLFTEKRKCCACEACVNICPKNAIEMQKDSQGFLYPLIDENKCVKCGLCTYVCGYQNVKQLNAVKSASAAVTQDAEISIKSASGGLFAILACTVIRSGGVVFGATMLKENDTLVVRHIAIRNESEIYLLQGSKYVQSRIGRTYQQAKKYLDDGVKVLFSGTPCQIAGLKGYLGKDYENLLSIDIICHGVPSEQFFQDYLTLMMERKKGKIEDFKFRDKTKGWGLTAKYIYLTQSGKKRIGLLPFQASSYYDMFINCETYRENCYSCPFAREERIGDLTLGDYWGIQKQHPEWMLSAGGIYSEETGISCVLVNSEKGEYALTQIADLAYILESDIQKIAKENQQLLEPSRRPKIRDEIMILYENEGYEAIEKLFCKRTGLKIYYYYLKNMIPRSMKNLLKKMLKKS